MCAFRALRFHGEFRPWHKDSVKFVASSRAHAYARRMSETAEQHGHHESLTALSIGAIGVVFGDIGTSPLYALKEVFHGSLATDEFHVLGVLSLIFWS